MMTSNCSNSLRSNDDQNNIRKHLRQKKNSAKMSFCRVCGDKANIKNYGGLSCQSCKIFFRRNGFRPENVHPCALKQSCEINLYTRRTCTACRLKKCLSIGMSSDLIRKEEAKNRNSKTKKSSLKREEKFPVHRSSNLNQHMITATEKKLIRKILHSYQTFTCEKEIHQIIFNFIDRSIQIDELMKTMIHFTYRSMYFIINSIPDFRVLTNTEQCSLMERNLHGLTSFHLIGILRDTIRSNQIYSLKLFERIYQKDFVFLVQLIQKYSNFDSTFLKLILIVSTFSSNCFIVNPTENSSHDSFIFGTHRLLGSQNVYVELLWKYLYNRFGYSKSIIYLEKVIGFIVKILTYSTTAYSTNETYFLLVNHFLKAIRISLLRNQNESMPLWGQI